MTVTEYKMKLFIPPFVGVGSRASTARSFYSVCLVCAISSVLRWHYGFQHLFLFLLSTLRSSDLAANADDVVVYRKQDKQAVILYGWFPGYSRFAE